MNKRSRSQNEESAAGGPTASGSVRPEVTLYTDGACSGNPGPGGWHYILKDVRTGRTKEESGADRNTTNNRMELTAVIRGLESLRRPARVELVTDSIYVAKGLSEWMPAWKRRGWSRKAGSHKPPVNLDLWKQLDRLAELHNIRTTHVAAHNGHPENERCDRLAVAAYRRLMEE